ncbi:hypothetical protein [Hymenobacter volaticus]|uniref:Uncharacterized protein n=1 Tax=Hymenobacter volaticus TaxID=2932254 RepID=A0ABY4GED9_9BACT|nr:hypothetical protein [Hymenobacter volaticus]UOQ69295.1 hypothetical protein MUN86_27985 [Hymenobacter volaticus]
MLIEALKELAAQNAALQARTATPKPKQPRPRPPLPPSRRGYGPWKPAVGKPSANRPGAIAALALFPLPASPCLVMKLFLPLILALPALPGFSQTLTNQGAILTVEAGARSTWPGACSTRPVAP